MGDRLLLIGGWFASRPRLSTLLLGLFSATGFPPLGMWPNTLAAMALFIVLLHRANSTKQAAILGWLFGWAHLSLANIWIAKAFTYQDAMPHFLGFFAVPVLCIYLALYPALAGGITYWLSARLQRRDRDKLRTSRLAFGILLAGLWIITEWLRSWVFTGYPWPPLGLAFLGDWQRPGMAILLPWLGTYALSGLVVLVAAIFASANELRLGKPIAAALLVVVIGAMTFPLALLDQAEGHVPYRLVQPNLQQDEITDASKFESQFATMARETFDRSNPERLVLWPESAVPDYLEDGYPQRYYRQMTAGSDPVLARRRIGRVIGSNSLLLAGVVDLEIGEVEGRAKAIAAHNAVMVMDGQGTRHARYTKAHLVPYGEYLAMRWLLEPLGAARLVPGSLDYWAGPGPETLDLTSYGPKGFGKAGIQICYEIVFSGQVTDRANRPDYIFNPSNDGWFGDWGPPQHLGQARLRAIEEGLPVLRSTTTGISAVIDANGIVRASIGRNRPGHVDGLIPPAKPPTLFAKMGNLLPLCWAILLILLSALALWKRRV